MTLWTSWAACDLSFSTIPHVHRWGLQHTRRQLVYRLSRYNLLEGNRIRFLSPIKLWLKRALCPRAGIRLTSCSPNRRILLQTFPPVPRRFPIILLSTSRSTALFSYLSSTTRLSYRRCDSDTVAANLALTHWCLLFKHAVNIECIICRDGSFSRHFFPELKETSRCGNFAQILRMP